MPSITPIKGKKKTSYKITVSMGRDVKGNQIRPTMTWTPEPGMTKRQIEKEVTFKPKTLQIFWRLWNKNRWNGGCSYIC